MQQNKSGGKKITRETSGGGGPLAMRRKSGINAVEFPLDLPPTPGTPQFLSEELLRTSKGILQQIRAVQEEFRAMLNIGRRMLEIDSHFISDRLGGPRLESDNDKMIGFGRLYACCKKLSEAILVTPPPTDDDIIDEGDKLGPSPVLAHTTLHRGLLQSTIKSCPEILGDPNGFPVSNLLTYCDQQLLLNLNAYFVAAVGQDKKYNGVNLRGRKLYEKPLGGILKRAIASHPDIQEHNKCFEKGNSPYSHQFKDYSAYTFIALEDLMLHLVSVQQYSVMVVKSYSDYIETAFRFMLPKLDSVFKVSSEGVVEILEMLAEIQAEWVDSPYIPIRDFVFGENCDCKPELVLSEYADSDLPGHLIKCLLQLDESFDHAHEIMAIHPEVAPSTPLTDIHRVSYDLRHSCEYLQARMEAIHQLVGRSNAMGKIVEKVGFTYAFDKFVESYESVFPRKKTNPPERVVDNESATEKKASEGVAAKQKQGAGQSRHALFASSEAGTSNLSPTSSLPPTGVPEEASADPSRRSGGASASIRSPRGSPRSNTGSPRVKSTPDSPRSGLSTSTEGGAVIVTPSVESPRTLIASYPTAKQADNAGAGAMISKVLSDLGVSSPSTGVAVAVIAPKSPLVSGGFSVQVRQSPKGGDASVQEQQHRKSPKPGQSLRDKSLRRQSFKVPPVSAAQVQADLLKQNTDQAKVEVQRPPELPGIGAAENDADHQEVNPTTGSLTPGGSSSGSTD